MADKPTLGERISSLEATVASEFKRVLEKIDANQLFVAEQMRNMAEAHAEVRLKVAQIEKDVETLKAQVARNTSFRETWLNNTWKVAVPILLTILTGILAVVFVR